LDLALLKDDPLIQQLDHREQARDAGPQLFVGCSWYA
jgi:hypothetical protein